MKKIAKLALILSLCCAAVAWGGAGEQKVYAIKDLDLSRREAAEALALSLGDNRLILYNGETGQIFPATYADMGIGAEMVTLAGKNGLDKLLGSQYGVALGWQPKALAEAIVAQSGFKTILPADAYFKIGYDNSVTIVPEVMGVALDMPLILREAVRRISPDSPTVLPLYLVKTPPEKTVEDLARLNIESLLGEFSTRFNGGDTKRTNNIWLAATQIEEVFLLPGQVFSFNQTVGPRTKERGFSEAGVIVNNRHEKGLGGGVCQVSSTLYNAAVSAKMTIIERHNHSVPVAYVAKGKDAAVVYGEKDLRFRNDTDNPVLIKTYFAYGKLTVKIFGKAPS